MILSPVEWEIVLLSLKVSGTAMAAILPVAFGLAWILARKRFAGKVVLDALIHLPLVLPPVVTGWLLLILFGINGPAGRFLADTVGLTFMFRWTGAALAAALIATASVGAEPNQVRRLGLEHSPGDSTLRLRFGL